MPELPHQPAAGPEASVREELENALKLMARLKTFATAVPVAKFSKKNDHESKFDFQNNESFFLLDYSKPFIHSPHTGLELLVLIRAFCLQMEKISAVDGWGIFKTPIPTADEIAANKGELYDYVNFVMARMTLPESIAHFVTCLLVNRSFSGRNVFSRLVSYLSSPFRESAPTPDRCYFAPQDAHSQHFYQSMRIFRNRGVHLVGNEVDDRQSGALNSLFVAPATGAPDEVKMRYYSERHLSIALYMLLTFERFYDEIADILNVSVASDSTADGSELLSKSKQLINQSYIGRARRQAADDMRKKFATTGLSDHPDLLYALPMPRLSLKQSDGTTVTADGDDLLTAEGASRRQLVVGGVGTGKTVMLLRMLQCDQPRLTPFYFSFDAPGALPSAKELLPELRRRVVGVENLMLTPAERQAVYNRLDMLLREGSVVFFIDSLDAAPATPSGTSAGVDALLAMVRAYPECRYIVATQPDAETPYREPLARSGFTEYKVCPLSDGLVRQFARMASLHISGIDHSDALFSRIRTAVQGSEMLSLPLSLMQLVDLFERNAGVELQANNLMQLYFKLEQGILGNTSIDEDERKQLLTQPFLDKYRQLQQQADGLYAEVMARYNARPQGDWAALIGDFTLDDGHNKKSLRQLVAEGNVGVVRTLFELMMNIVGRDEGSQSPRVFQTLVTTALINLGLNREQAADTADVTVADDGRLTVGPGELPALNPVIRLLAEATSTLAFDRPGPSEYMDVPAACGGSVVFRLQPRYMVEQYLLSVLNVYRQGGATPSAHDRPLRLLFEAVARSGSELLARELFNPYWLRQWLISKDDVLPGTDEHGMAFSHAPLTQTVIVQSTCHHVVVAELLRCRRWIDKWELKNTLGIWQEVVRDAVVFNMNDEQREMLLRRMYDLEGQVDARLLTYYRNLVICSMQSLAFAEQYDDSILELPGLEVQNRLMDLENRPEALRLLLAWVRQLLRDHGSANRRHRVYDIFGHLVRFDAPSTDSVKDEFWALVNDMADDEAYAGLLAGLLDKIAIEEIPSDLARRIYDERVYEYVLRVRQAKRELSERWKRTPTVWQRRDELFRPVSKEWPTRLSVQFTFYCHPDPYTFEVATECISEMPERKFCRIRHFDQWFYVEDVVVTPTERPLDKGIAELTLSLKEGSPRPAVGRFSIPAVSEAQIPYIHLFEKKGCSEVVVRIEEQHWVSLLSTAETQALLREQRTVRWGSHEALLTGIDIRPVPENMRIVRMKAVGNPGPSSNVKAVNKVALEDIPHEGELTFHHVKSLERSEHGIALSSPSRENMAQATTLATVLYLGMDDDCYYVAVPKQLNAGNRLIWDGKPARMAIVDEVFDPKSEQVPPGIRASYQHFIGGLYGAYNRARAAGQRDVDRPYYPKIVALKFEGAPRLEKHLFPQQGLVSQPARVTFYHPVVDPHPTSWDETADDVAFTAVEAHRAKVDGRLLLVVQPADYPDNIAYYYDPYYKKRLPVEWYVAEAMASLPERPFLFALDPRLERLWRKPAFVRFYTSEDPLEQPVGIRFRGLMDVVNLGKPTRYHASVTPLLIREWAAAGSLDPVWVEYCNNKRQLGMLLEEWIARGLPIGDDLTLEIAYVLNIRDRHNMTIFVPQWPKEGPDKLNWKYWCRTGKQNHYGDRPAEVKAGMLILRCKSLILPLSQHMIARLRRHLRWGFMQGEVERCLTGGQSVSIVVPGCDVNFIGSRLAGNDWLEIGQKVVFFPIANPDNKMCAEATHIVVTKA